MTTTTATIDNLQATILKKYSTHYNLVREEEEGATVLMLHPHGNRMFKKGIPKLKNTKIILR